MRHLNPSPGIYLKNLLNAQIRTIWALIGFHLESRYWYRQRTSSVGLYTNTSFKYLTMSTYMYIGFITTYSQVVL